MMEIKDLDHARKILWACLFEFGTVIDAQTTDHWDTWNCWNQYGGRYDGVKCSEAFAGIDLQSSIDWEATGIPEYHQRSEFVGTGSPNNQIETMMGKLCFRDGSVKVIGAHKITDVMRECKFHLEQQTVKLEEDLVSKWGL